MKGLGWPFGVRDEPWANVRTFLAGFAWTSHHAYPVEIVDSVLSCGADKYLAVTTSMHDLISALKPVGDPPMDVIAVRAPGSIRDHPAGTVLIEHLSVLGAHTKIERPEDEAVALFWRFVQTEFGISPTGLEAEGNGPARRAGSSLDR